MNFYFSELVTAPAILPLTVDAADKVLAAAVVQELELVLGRAIVAQTRRILIDGELPSRLEFEPSTAITQLTRWTPDDDVEVIADDEYNFVSRDPAGTIVVPLNGWPAPERSIGSFALTYECGWEVTDSSNMVPAAILHMISRAIAFREGSGLSGFTVSGLKVETAPSYRTDKIPSEIIGIARAYAYKPGIFIGRP